MIGITKTSLITEDLLPKTKQIMTREELDKLIVDTDFLKDYEKDSEILS